MDTKESILKAVEAKGGVCCRVHFNNVIIGRDNAGKNLSVILADILETAISVWFIPTYVKQREAAILKYSKANNLPLYLKRGRPRVEVKKE